MPKPTSHDAEMVFDLLRQIGTTRFQEARDWFMKDFSATDYEEFVRKYPEGSREYNHVTTVLGFYEIVGALITHGLINEDLFFDINFGLTPIWKRISPIIPGWQKATGPSLWENAVWLAHRSDVWAKTVWKPDLKWKNA